MCRSEAGVAPSETKVMSTAQFPPAPCWRPVGAAYVRRLVAYACIDIMEATDVGEPCQRTFKITVSSPRGEAVVWMEKEQLFQIGLSIKQFVSVEDAPSSPKPYKDEYPAPPTPSSAEFKARFEF